MGVRLQKSVFAIKIERHTFARMAQKLEKLSNKKGRIAIFRLCAGCQKNAIQMNDETPQFYVFGGKVSLATVGWRGVGSNYDSPRTSKARTVPGTGIRIFNRLRNLDLGYRHIVLGSSNDKGWSGSGALKSVLNVIEGQKKREALGFAPSNALLDEAFFEVLSKMASRLEGLRQTQ